MRKEFRNLDAMKRWLISAAGVTIVAVGLQSKLGNLYTNITSPIAIASAIQTSQVYSDCQLSRPCFVEYEIAEATDPFPDLDYEQFMAAFTAKVVLASNRRTYGGHEILAPEISEHDYFVVLYPPGPGFQIGYVLVRMPQDPMEVASLKKKMLDRSILVTVPDGSGEMHTGNTFNGKGFTPV